MNQQYCEACLVELGKSRSQTIADETVLFCCCAMWWCEAHLPEHAAACSMLPYPNPHLVVDEV